MRELSISTDSSIDVHVCMCLLLCRIQGMTLCRLTYSSFKDYLHLNGAQYTCVCCIVSPYLVSLVVHMLYVHFNFQTKHLHGSMWWWKCGY